jgi:ubiquinone/menaquinone biosynthesis C-methylase UbiE
VIVSGPHEHRPTHRFSHRVADYVRFRPSYPSALITWLGDTIDFAPSWRVADVGSGTGIFARLLVENGNVVHGVEPNDAMRLEAEAALGSHANFASTRGSAEATTLPDHAFDLVTTAQAFHWFEPIATKHEFQRILKPGGWTLIVFNSRRDNASPFMQAYEAFLRTRAVDYRSVDHRLVDPARLRAFLGDYREWRMNFSVFHDLEGVMGLSSSSSYTPAPDHPEHDGFYAALRELFAAHAVDGQVEFLYETEAYVGRV